MAAIMIFAQVIASPCLSGEDDQYAFKGAQSAPQ
jgi:hypothetical protein